MWPLAAVTRMGMDPVTVVGEHVRVTTSGVEQQSLVNVWREGDSCVSVCVLTNLCSIHRYHVSNTLKP